MTPNQQAVVHFLDALQAFHYQGGYSYWIDDLRSDVVGGETYMSLLGLRNISNNWSVAATWRNQAKQAAILLQGDNQ